nr:DUF488 family protein [Paenibacillus pinistramenti]
MKRIYDPFSLTDGRRILVDRLWPRGISREQAAIDDWFKEIAPSPELRKWFAHRPERFAAFEEQYLRELAEDAERQRLAAQIRSWASAGTVTLLYAAKDPVHNHGAVLLDFIRRG